MYMSYSLRRVKGNVLLFLAPLSISSKSSYHHHISDNSFIYINQKISLVVMYNQLKHILPCSDVQVQLNYVLQFTSNNSNVLK